MRTHFTIAAIILTSWQTLAETMPYIRLGEDYGIVRSQLLLRGLTPTETSGQCFAGDGRCKDRREVVSCSGTGLAQCRFRWRGANGLVFDVVTVGEMSAGVERVECVENCGITNSNKQAMSDDTLPVADVEADCNRQSLGNTLSFNACLSINQSAYDDVKAIWDNVPSGVRVACKAKFGPRQPHYYRTMRSCLEAETDKVEIEEMKKRRGAFRY